MFKTLEYAQAKRSVFSYLLIILLGEKVIQHVIVSLSFLYDIGGIRSTVAVDDEALMISGAIIAVLFVVALWGVIRKTNWGLFLVALLAIFDIVGEFVAQGTPFPATILPPPSTSQS
jgi:uncharacterized membrane protein (UPF0136 family)